MGNHNFEMCPILKKIMSFVEVLSNILYIYKLKGAKQKNKDKRRLNNFPLVDALKMKESGAGRLK